MTQTDDALIELVKQALENLYDLPTLQRHPLAARVQHGPDELPGHRLRHELMAAVESLNPGTTVAARSGAARLYRLMYLHYVGGMTLQETAYELGISLRQAYRDLRRGQESVSEILRYRLGHDTADAAAAPQDVSPATHSPPRPTDAAALSSVESEVQRLAEEPSVIQLHEVIDAGMKAVARLADARDVRLAHSLPPTPVPVTTRATPAQQVIVGLLSASIQAAAAGGTVHLALQADEGQAELRLRFPMAQESTLPPVIARLIDSLGWRFSSTRSTTQQTFTLRMGGGGVVLIIDDNAGLVELLERYLTGERYRVLSARSGPEGLALAGRAVPDVIVMDLMMPGMDGWELLQHLRTQPQTRQTPVIICSVINDPALAYSLGASQFISKPVTKETLLAALQQVGV